MKINYSHLHLCKTCHGTGLIAPPEGTRASFFPCDRCMGRGTLDEEAIINQVAEAIRPHVLKGCKCTETQKKKGIQSSACPVHDLDLTAMAQAAIQVASRYD
ncbi:MAG: hypothetical protein HQL84_05915 [Magnetococcales bacterium]|nr:hypothetical protein [Magnetococcales bacterium]MBF0149567.1 hypothetical protein [Magnetococcales bacterium]MBF0346885.1 hypothetical protein [Magnetococcales bacterium]MBF0632080.1 hypothetical protein [Magnetococcales bacterium]